MKVFIIILSLLVGGLCFTHDSFSKSVTVQHKKDSLQIVYFINKAQQCYSEALYDSLFIYNNKCFNLAIKTKKTTFYPKIYLYYALYYRGKKNRDMEKAINMCNSALHWAILNKNLEEIEIINYRKLTIYTDIYYITNNEKNQTRLSKQIFENIRFSKISKSDKHLYKTLFLLKELYSLYIYDKKFASYYNNEIFNTPIPKNDANYNYVYFDIYINQGKYNLALNCFKQLKKNVINKSISDVIYSYYINVMLAKSIDIPVIANIISNELITKLDKLTGSTDSIMYYNSFTKLSLIKGNIKKAIYFNLKAKKTIENNQKNTPLAIKYLYNTYSEEIFEKQFNFKKSLEFSKKKRCN